MLIMVGNHTWMVKILKEPDALLYSICVGVIQV
jgi:hypothetical protein